MKLAFFHDHKFMVNNGFVYTTGTLDSKIWSRYFVGDIDRVIVCARVVAFDEKQAGAISSANNVDFVFSPNVSNLKSMIFNFDTNVISDAVKNSDFVIARLPSEIGIHACKEAIRLNKPYLCEVVGCPYDALMGHGSYIAKIYAFLAKFRMKSVIFKSSAAIYVTEKILQNRYPAFGRTESISNVEIINVVGYDVVNKRIERFLKRKASGKLKIGLIGSVKNNIKGVDVAIKSMIGLNASLHVIGSGLANSQNELANSLGVDFHFDGFLSDSNMVFSWLDDIDIYIQPSLQEGLPRATIEAMSRGCPVFSSDAGGLTELTIDKFIHKKSDYFELRRQLVEFISDSDDQLSSSIKHSLDISKKYLLNSLSDRRKKILSCFFGSP